VHDQPIKTSNKAILNGGAGWRPICPSRKKFAINTLDGGMTVPSKTTHTERVETTVRHRTPYA
ncbi:hypothetical protein, partial [Aeromonas hydrophila]|uniref:hypothetical protein n=1 Tax=Aeromonas hydrophila TaxID=644 RepID=UPI0036DF0301